MHQKQGKRLQTLIFSSIIFMGTYLLKNLKKYTIWNFSPNYLILFFKLSGFRIEGANRHPTGFRCLPKWYFLAAPCLMYRVEILWERCWRTSEFHPARLGCGDAFGLPLPDRCPFILSYKRQNLQYQVCNECPHQVFALSGVQKRHI